MFSIILVALAAAVATHGAATASDCARTYTVKAGDTCDSISSTQGVSTFQLVHVNSQINAACDNLVPGESLCLGITGQDCRDLHVVQSGDVCYKIAAAAGTTLEILLANNPNVNSDCTNIGSGEVLCTAKTVIPYTN